jgi:hypothetical protein
MKLLVAGYLTSQLFQFQNCTIFQLAVENTGENPGDPKAVLIINFIINHNSSMQSWAKFAMVCWCLGHCPPFHHFSILILAQHIEGIKGHWPLAPIVH